MTMTTRALDEVRKTHFDPKHLVSQAGSKVLLNLQGKKMPFRPDAPEVVFVLTMHLRGATPLRASII
jgi:hypothetical protein